MNAFIATVIINDITVDYEVFPICKKFKAILKQTELAKYIPYQLDFWKEKEVWKSYHPLSQEVINQFGSQIDHQLMPQKSDTTKKSSVA